MTAPPRLTLVCLLLPLAACNPQDAGKKTAPAAKTADAKPDAKPDARPTPAGAPEPTPAAAAPTDPTVPLAKERQGHLRRSSIKFTNGSAASFELTQEQGNYLLAQQAYIQRMVELLMARADLRKALDLY